MASSCSCMGVKGVGIEAYTPGGVSNVAGSSDQPSGGWLQPGTVPTIPPMHTRHCLKIADRIHRLLVREIGQGLDRQRMLREPLYARDVLLVCDALKATDAPFLAQHFRRAAQGVDEAEQAALAKGRAFSVSGWLNSLFGPPSGFGEPAASVRSGKRPEPAR